MSKLIAHVTSISGGYDSDKKRVKELGLEVGQQFNVISISMGQSHTTVAIELPDGSKAYMNSIYFDFSLDGKPHDIYEDPDYNPYLHPLRD
jgi:hypothetical protein